MMRQTMLIIALTAGLLSGVAWSQDIEPLSASSMPTSKDYWEELVADRLERQAMLDELMGTMAAEMALIRKTKDHNKRQEFMATHKRHMREAMRLMRGMGGKRMREVMSQHMDPTAEQLSDAEGTRNIPRRAMLARPQSEVSDAQRLSDLEIRLDMMQVMMESFMENYGETNSGRR